VEKEEQDVVEDVQERVSKMYQRARLVWEIEMEQSRITRKELSSICARNGSCWTTTHC
jgi:predicted metal-binding protein